MGVLLGTGGMAPVCSGCVVGHRRYVWHLCVAGVLLGTGGVAPVCSGCVVA